MNACTRRDCAHWWDECGTGYHYCNFLDCCYTKEIKLEPIEEDKNQIIKKIKYHNEQYKKVEMGKAYSWFLQHMLEFIEIENLNVGHHITINNEKMWEKFKKAMEE